MELLVPVSADGLYPPRILSAPVLEARVGEQWRYDPVAVGSPRLSWSVGKQLGTELTRAPDGMHVDPDLGTLTWTPGHGRAGPVPVTLVVRNDAGSDFQDFEVEVDEGGPAGGCGCSSSSTPPACLALVLLLALAWLRRYQSFFSNRAMSAPQIGQTQAPGRSSKSVPGETPFSGSPFSGS